MSQSCSCLQPIFAGVLLGSFHGEIIQESVLMYSPHICPTLRFHAPTYIINYVIVVLSSSGMAHGRMCPVLRFHAPKLSPNIFSFIGFVLLLFLPRDAFETLRYNPKKTKRKIRGNNEALVSRP